MAELPSGRHIALVATPLFTLLDDSLRENAVITRLLRIERAEHLHPYVHVVYFVAMDGARVEQTAPGGLPVPAGLQPYPSGFSLTTIAAELATWPEPDRAAFAAYLASERVQAWLRALLDQVRERLAWLVDQGGFEHHLQMLMWLAKCHPAQTGETGDPLFDLLEEPYDPNAAARR